MDQKIPPDPHNDAKPLPPRRVPQLGDRVMYTYSDGDLAEAYKTLVGQIRPAVIVRSWGGTAFNLQVFTDGTNDGKPSGIFWKTSCTMSVDPMRGCFHYDPLAPVATSAK